MRCHKLPGSGVFCVLSRNNLMQRINALRKGALLKVNPAAEPQRTGSHARRRREGAMGHSTLLQMFAARPFEKPQ
jgi:hypothetical protein